jgi:hypothetical protein
MLARILPYFNTKTLTLNLANMELGEGFRDFSYACELVGWRRRLPLASPFIGAPRGGRPACPCGHCSSIMQQSSGGWAKEDISGEESGKRESRWPVGRPSPGLHSPPSTPSCSHPAQTTNQKHQKQDNFLSFFSKVPFIYIFHLKFLILWHGMMGNKNMLWKSSK